MKKLKIKLVTSSVFTENAPYNCSLSYQWCPLYRGLLLTMKDSSSNQEREKPTNDISIYSKTDNHQFIQIDDSTRQNSK